MSIVLYGATSPLRVSDPSVIDYFGLCCAGKGVGPLETSCWADQLADQLMTLSVCLLFQLAGPTPCPGWLSHVNQQQGHCSPSREVNSLDLKVCQVVKGLSSA